jgi:phosphatidylinositol-4,5-bisphosphate 4-phosphatase
MFIFPLARQAFQAITSSAARQTKVASKNAAYRLASGKLSRDKFGPCPVKQEAIKNFAPSSELGRRAARAPGSALASHVLRLRHMQAARTVLASLAPDMHGDAARLDDLHFDIDRIDRCFAKLMKQAENDPSQLGDRLSKNDKSLLESEPKALRKIITKYTGDKKLAKSMHNEAFRNQLNSADWRTFETTLISGWSGKAFACVHRPAAEMTLGGGHNVFKVDYKGNGVASSTRECTDHAVNMWSSELRSPDGKFLFQGIRHAILSPFTLARDSQERKEGAYNRAVEVVTAALMLDPQRVESAISDNATIDLRLSSASLVTPSDLFGTEGEQIRDQREAWRAVASQQPLALQVRDAGGELRTVKVNVQVAAFNFGVNEIALKTPWQITPKAETEANLAAFAQLFGGVKPDAPIEGWAGRYLTANPNNAATVRTLVEQIRTLWEKGAAERDVGEVYGLPQRVALLSHEIGVVPCWNCKSGKDRTGMLDVAIKQAAIEQHERGAPQPVKAEMTPERTITADRVLTNGGNFEIQAYNTGVSGNKVLRFTDGGLLSKVTTPLSVAPLASQEKLKLARGLSGYV